MKDNAQLAAETYEYFDKLIRLAGVAVYQAQEESRRLGVPNVYSFNGRIYFETPTGELTLEDPYDDVLNISNPTNDVRLDSSG